MSNSYSCRSCTAMVLIDRMRKDREPITRVLMHCGHWDGEL